MRIAIVSTLRPYNEVRIYQRQAVQWAGVGEDVHMVARACVGQPPPQVRNITVHELGTKWRGLLGRLRLGWQAWRMVRQLRPDVVNYHDPEWHVFAFLVHISGIAVVYDVRENHPFLVEHYNRFWLKPLSKLGAYVYGVLERWFLRKISLVFVTEGLAQCYQPLARPFCVAMNFAAAANIKPTGPSQDPILLTGGSLNEDRGIFDLIEIMDEVRQQVPGVKLLLCGKFQGEELKMRIEHTIRAKGLDSVVEIVPYMPHAEYISTILPRVRLGLCFYRPNEQIDVTFPVRLGEYWAAALPSISSRMPDVEAIWRKDSFFEVCDFEDRAGLVDLIAKYLRDFELSRTRGVNARAMFEQYYSGESEFAKLRKFYHQILSARSQ